MFDPTALALAGAFLVLVGMLLGTSISDRYLRHRTRQLAELRRDVNEKLRLIQELEIRHELAHHSSGGVTWRRTPQPPPVRAAEGASVSERAGVPL